MRKLFFLVMAILTTSNAFGTLDDGKQSLRYGFYHSWAKNLWKKKDTAKVQYGGEGKTNFSHHNLLYSRGLAWKMQVDGSVTYSQTKMKKGAEGGSTKGDKVNRVSSVLLGAGRNLLTKSWIYTDAFFHIACPLKVGPSSTYKESPDVFIAPSDGAVKYRLTLWNQFNFIEKFSVNLSGSYTFRSGEAADQLEFNLLVPLRLSKKFHLGPGLNYKNTLGGPDIGTPEFAQQVALRSGGNSKVKAFSVVNEDVLGVSLMGTYLLSNHYLIDAYWNKSFEGRNTDVSTTLGFGITRKF